MRTSVLTSLLTVRLVLASAAMVLALSISLADVALAQTTDGNTDRPGGDFRRFEIVPRTNSIAGDGVTERCRDTCERSSGCLAWTAVRPGVQSKYGVCWLKRTVTEKKSDSCCTSGTSSRVTVVTKTGKAPTGGGTTPTPTSASVKILSYAQSNLNKCVDRKLNVRAQRCPSLPINSVGDGECTDLVNGAVVSAGFARVNGFVWGTPVGDNTTANKSVYRPGDIIQLFKYRFSDPSNPRNFFESSSQHTAIIEANNNGVLSLLEQNTNVGGENRRYVTRSTLNLNWKLEHGTYIVYRK
jgi:hypothetical protein